MSAWYLFSAMGFYPFNPCGGEYVLGAPQVPEARIRVGEREFRVIAKNLSRENKYVKSVTLNGKPVTGWRIRHADIMAGGELVFEMVPAFDAYGRAVASEDAGAGRVSVPVSETPVYFLGAWPTEIAKPSAE